MRIYEPQIMVTQLRTLGELDLRGPDGRELRQVLVQPKRIALLTYLAAATPRGFHRRDSLLALLWPDQDDAHARASLRQALHALREAMGDGVLLSRGSEVGLARESFTCDVCEFDDALRQHAAARAVALYGGEFLPGFFLSGAPEFERWVEEERSRLSREYAVALERLAEATSPTDVAAAVGWWRKLAAHDPYSPRVALRLMQALQAAGDAPAAIRHADQYRTRLRDDLEAEPDPQIQALADRLRKTPPTGALPPELPAPPTAEAATPANAIEPAPPGALPATTPPRSAGRWSRKPVLALGLLLVASATWWLTMQRAEAEPLSLAVLPFSLEGSDPRYDYLAEGLTEALSSGLGMIGELRVVSGRAPWPRADADRSRRRIAEELGVSRVVEGNVMAAGGRIRIQVRLVDPLSDDILLDREYGGRIDDLFQLDDQAVQDVARALRVAVTPGVRARLERSPTADFRAYDLYLRGWLALNDWNLLGLDSAISLLQAAVSQDSSFALARAALANALLEKMDLYGHRPELQARAYLLTETALYQDSLLPEAHLARGNLLWTAANNFPHDLAHRAFQRAADLQPSLGDAHHRLALVYTHVGLLDLALSEARTAAALNPLDHWARFRVAHALATQQNYGEALAELDALPAHVIPQLRTALRGEALLYLGRKQEASRYLEAMADSMPDDPWVRGTRALVRASLGDVRGAETDIAVALEKSAGRAHGHHAQFQVGLSYAVLGRNRDAVRWLRQAAETGWPCYPRYANDPILARLNAEPELAEFLGELRGEWAEWARKLGHPVPSS